MRIKFHRVEQKEKKFFRSNSQIRSEEVFLIDETGENVGVMTTREAIDRAKELDLDLVEVNPKANPPVAKIVDLGQLKYEHEKKLHRQKVMQKKIDTKVVRLSFRISEHDFNFRLMQAEKFLLKENKLKVELILRGRERQYPQKGREIIDNFVAKLRQIEGLNIEIEQPLTNQGGRFTMVLMNKK
ncbi:MAG: translation initiation factor IF-3 [Bacillota bacterium]